MNPAGIVVAIAGTWIITQVFAGNALERLNILKPAAAAAGGGGLIPGLPDPGDLTPYLPGGPKNPTVPTFPDIFGNQIGGKYL